MTRIYPYPGAENPETYEWENRIADPDQRIEAFMRSVKPLDATVVDIGSGSAFHAWRFAHDACAVFAVEPSPLMLAQAAQRPALANLHLVRGEAEHIPLCDGCADIAHSRFAYFFGPEPGWQPDTVDATHPGTGVSSCEAGIGEVLRILGPGGAFFVIDNHLTSGEFAGLLYRYGYVRDPGAEQARRDQFWRHHGFTRKTVASCWRAPGREVLAAVMAMEFPGHEDSIMSEIAGNQLSYQYDVYWRVVDGQR